MGLVFIFSLSFEAQWARGPRDEEIPREEGIPGMGEVDQIPNLPGLGGPVGSGPPPQPTIGFRGARGGQSIRWLTPHSSSILSIWS